MDKLKDPFITPKAPSVVILGVPFDNLTTAETIQMIEQMVLSRRSHYLATANVDFLLHASHDVELRRILFDAHLVLCDGTPLVWASKLLGNPLPERVAGSDIVPLLLKVAAEKGYRPFFLGASTESLETAVKRAKEKNPGLEIAGYYSPPFNKLLEMDHEEILQRIIHAQPDILFVGFGCPKQEKWINMHYPSLGVPVCVGVGGTIDFIAGKLVRAPMWMQKTGTEWIFRLAQEPRRLFSRYAKDLRFFCLGIARQFWELHIRKTKAFPVPTPTSNNAVNYDVIELGPRLDFEEVHSRQTTLESIISSKRACVLNLQQVDFIDSTGIGLLIRLQKRARALGQQLILASPTSQVTRALELMRLNEFFVFVPDLAAAEAWLKEIGRYSSVALRTTLSSNFPALSWRGELTAANAEEIWIQTMDHLAARALVQRVLTIDLSKLRFIDSTGLSILIRTRKYGARQGIKITFTDLQPNVLSVVRLSRLEEYLLNGNE